MENISVKKSISLFLGAHTGIPVWKLPRSIYSEFYLNIMVRFVILFNFAVEWGATHGWDLLMVVHSKDFWKAKLSIQTNLKFSICKYNVAWNAKNFSSPNKEFVFIISLMKTNRRVKYNKIENIPPTICSTSG